MLIQRVRELLRRGVPAERILATTFNRDAGIELAARLQQAGVRGVEARTFHSLGLRILSSEGLARRNGVRQLSLGQWKRLCTLALRDTGTWVDPADARAAISDIKLGQLRSVPEFVGDETIARIYARYEAEKRLRRLRRPRAARRPRPALRRRAPRALAGALRRTCSWTSTRTSSRRRNC